MIENMSLRDYFAAKCIPAALEKAKAGNIKEYELKQLFGDRTGIKAQEIIAALAYELADAMIAHRNRPTGVPKAAPIRRDDWHYDSQGYCDNPGRGY